ncbi:MAG TPA: ATP-grasp domain-containing protein [Bacteroidota bacterium]|nr:ATP-grasp domain-containing protein [Bacteroidota bacterium]
MKHSLGMIRSLARQGHAMYGLVNFGEKQPLSKYSRYCRGVFPLEQEREDAFIEGLILLLERQAFDVLIPVGFPVTHFVAMHRTEIERRTHVLAPDAGAERTATDKYGIQLLARGLGVPSPNTFRIGTRDDIGKAVAQTGFPAVIKGSRENAKGIVATAYTREEAFGQFEHLVTKFSLAPEEYPLVQEFIPGWGCGFFAIYDNGQCKRVFMHRRIREFPPSGGVSCCARSFHDPRLEDYGTRILNALHWNGVAMVEFRYDKRKNDYCLMEVNAKFWGSLELSLACGADFPADYVKIATGQPTNLTDTYRTATYQWLLSGDLLHGMKRPSALPSIIFTMFNPSVHKDFLQFDDPLVLIVRVFKLFKEMVNLALHIR